MSLPAETQVLVVGAGPTGLTAAISLIHNGIAPSKITVVDAVSSGMNSSRAVSIHAATLEDLDSLGCADKLVELGHTGGSWGFANRSSRFFEYDFSYLSSYTKFPFTLRLSQAVTEHVLEEHLKGMGVQVIRPFRVTGMRSNAVGDGTDVLFESGETIRADCVIGADGAKSVVRQLSGIRFADPDGNPMEDHPIAQMVLADVSFSQADGEPFNSDSIAGLIMSREGLFILEPLGQPTVGELLYDCNETVYRVGFNVPPSLGQPPSNPPLEYIQSNVDRQGPLRISSDPHVNPHSVQISKLHWSTRFRTHSAVADVFFKRVHGGIVLLVGDAAHIHSPAGGQGMNLGLRDAVALGPVLADYIRKYQAVADGAPAEAGEDTYFQEFAAERRKRALDNILLTKTFIRVVDTLVKPRIFNWPVWSLRVLNRIPPFKRHFMWQMSGLGNR